MSFEYQSNDRNDYFQIDVQGPITLSELFGLFEVIRNESEDHKSRRIFLDLTKATGHTSTSERFRLGKEAARIWGNEIKVSILVDRSVKINQMFETVAVNRGANVRVFHEKVQALEWLLT